MPIAFISSTSEDLKHYRAAAGEGAARAGFAVDMMEYFGSGPNLPLNQCLQKVDAADVVVLIVAHRFGWVPSQTGDFEQRKSITWLECERAQQNGTPIFPYIIGPGAPYDDKLKEENRLGPAIASGNLSSDKAAELLKEIQHNVAQLKAFKNWINDSFIRETFTNTQDLRGKVAEALVRWLHDHPELIRQAEPEPPKPQVTNDPDAYLRSLELETCSIDIHGLRVGTGTVYRFPIDEIYIPLKTTGHLTGPRDLDDEQQDDKQQVEKQNGPAAGTAGRRDKQLLEEHRSDHVALDEALAQERLVIVGDPGAGKTTFIRRVAWLLCKAVLDDQRDILRQRLSFHDGDLDADILPAFIRVSDLAEHIRVSADRNDRPTNSNSPAWLADFLGTRCQDRAEGLDAPFFQQQIAAGKVLFLIDGLDEAPSDRVRQKMSALIKAAATAYRNCRMVVSTRPSGYHDRVVLSGFTHAEIDALDDQAIAGFLGRWTEALFPENAPRAAEHLADLLGSLAARMEIRRLARNPVMLTALGVVHWNERRMPEQRAELYESILMWLARSRDHRQDRLPPEQTLAVLQELALAMQMHPDGRQVQVSRRWAAEQMQHEFRGLQARERLAAAERFLDDEELDSGIVVRRGNDVRFWHLTFQEYLAARALAAREDSEQRELLLNGGVSCQLASDHAEWPGLERGTSETPEAQSLEPGLPSPAQSSPGHPQTSLYDPAWREMLLLFTGVLYHQGPRKVDGWIEEVLNLIPADASLTNKSQAVALLGGMVADLDPFDFVPEDARYRDLLDSVLAIFDRDRCLSVAMPDALAAADALGKAGDPRFTDRKLGKHWVPIPAGVFLMGSQKDDPAAANYDPHAENDENWNETPPHEVSLPAFDIGKYPVTVCEYRRFVESEGYHREVFWPAGGFGKWTGPGKWDDQLQVPTRPVIHVSWYEAMAYAAWSGARLPTEAEWEYAARGTSARIYPWGAEVDETQRQLNDAGGEFLHPTPVGMYPHGDTPAGAEDMAGNVWEWCFDPWDKDFYGRSPRENPIAESDDHEGARVLRGGSWLSSPLNCRAACRSHDVPDNRNSSIGFRLCR